MILILKDPQGINSSVRYNFTKLVTKPIFWKPVLSLLDPHGVVERPGVIGKDILNSPRRLLESPENTKTSVSLEGCVFTDLLEEQLIQNSLIFTLIREEIFHVKEGSIIN